MFNMEDSLRIMNLDEEKKSSKAPSDYKLEPKPQDIPNLEGSKPQIKNLKRRPSDPMNTFTYREKQFSIVEEVIFDKTPNSKEPQQKPEDRSPRVLDPGLDIQGLSQQSHNLLEANQQSELRFFFPHIMIASNIAEEFLDDNLEKESDLQKDSLI